MFASLALSRPIKIALSVLIAALVALLLWSLLFRDRAPRPYKPRA